MAAYADRASLNVQLDKLFEVVYAFVVISLLDSVACSVNAEVATMSVVHTLD